MQLLVFFNFLPQNCLCMLGYVKLVDGIIDGREPTDPSLGPEH